MHTVFHVIVDYGQTFTFLNYADAEAFVNDGEYRMDQKFYVVVPSVVDQPTYDKIRRFADAPEVDRRL